MARSLVWLALIALITTGCATRGSVHRVESEVLELREDLTDLRQDQDMTARELARTQADLKTVDGRATELATAVRESAGEVATLRGRLEAADEELRQLRAAAVATATPPSPSAALPPATSSPTPEPRQLRELSPSTLSPEEAYNAALATFRAREHGQAVLDFLDFLARYPKHPLAGNAQYWIGEAYYVQRDYRQAIVEFQKVAQIAPTSPKIADALVKIGLCYNNLRDRRHAQDAWQRVVREHPGTDAARLARGLLRPRPASTSKR
jgi:tol-pal system protein YbgF